MTPEPTTVRQALARAARRLSVAGVDSPALSARLLLGHVLGLDDIGLVRDAYKHLDASHLAAYEALVDRRAAGEPAAYILGRREFFGLDFAVTPATLVPRPESEHLVEQALGHCGDSSALLQFADLGTGSGCLAVCFALHRPRSMGVAVDRSLAALAVARKNARAHGVEGRLLFARCDFGALCVQNESLDLVLANPPYVSAAEYKALSREVSGYEPRTALVPSEGEGGSGLEAIASLLPESRRVLKGGGALVSEIGWEQGSRCLELARATRLPDGRRFEQCRIIQDLAGRDRVLFAVAG
ncbi:MAG: peptide chain release factor N(5)-glutamine methyltransferase [Oceanidesulfovibrio sp.]